MPVNPSELKQLFPKSRFRIIQLKQTIRTWLFRVPGYYTKIIDPQLMHLFVLKKPNLRVATVFRINIDTKVSSLRVAFFFCWWQNVPPKNLRVQETFHVSNRPGYARMFHSFLGDGHWKFSAALPLTQKKVLERPNPPT